MNTRVAFYADIEQRHELGKVWDFNFFSIWFVVLNNWGSLVIKKVYNHSIQLLFMCCPSHNASLRIQIPGSQISTEICIKLFTKPIRHLVEKLSSDIEGLAWYSFWKHYSPKSRYVFANSSSCQYDAVEVSFQEKLDGLFWSAVVSRASRFRLLFYSLITSLVILMLSIFSRLSIDSCT